MKARRAERNEVEACKIQLGTLFDCPLLRSESLIQDWSRRALLIGLFDLNFKGDIPCALEFQGYGKSISYGEVFH
jgi:hypothetical protein